MYCLEYLYDYVLFIVYSLQVYNLGIVYIYSMYDCMYVMYIYLTLPTPTHTYLQPYNLGIVSARPFTVVAEYGPPVFQRGALHVYYASLSLHVIVVHLHAHSSRSRIQEAQELVKVCMYI